MKNILKRIISLVLILTILPCMGMTPGMVDVYAAQPDTLSMSNGNIEVIVSTKNGGFLIRTRDGDVIAKDDDNKELLYHSDDFDTSFTSFQVTEGGTTKEYIFGGNYSFLGLGGNNLTVTQEDTGIKAVWTVDGLTFTQLLEPVADAGFQEHGTVKISYSVLNSKGNAVSVKARLLLDTALGAQDYAYYELADSPESSSFNRIEREQVISVEDGGYIPASFFAFDNYNNPSIAAYTIRDESDSTLWPYKIAFGHWNNMASTIFEFVPDGDLTFTNPYNRAYLTADSAFAQYYNPGDVAAGSQKTILSTYYGVDSKVRLKRTDKVGITVTSTSSLMLSVDKTKYIGTVEGLGDGVFRITTNITNLAREGAQNLEKIAVAVLVDDGLYPLDNYGGELGIPDNLNPYNVEIVNLGVGAIKQLTWLIRAEVQPETSFRKVVFRAYDMSDSDGLMLLDNMIGSSTAYILCPGGEGDLPEVIFTGSSPRVIYNEGIRHIYITGKGFNYLTATGNYQLRAYLKNDRSRYFVIPESNIIFPPDEPGVLDIVLDEAMPAGDYELVFDWHYPIYGLEPRMTSPILSFTVTTDEAYRNDYYGIVAIVKSGKNLSIKYYIKVFADENEFNQFSGDVLLVFRGMFTVDEVDYDGTILGCSAVSRSKKDTININGALDLEDGNVQIFKQTSGEYSYIMVEFNGDLYTTNSRTSVWKGHATITPLYDGADFGLIKYDSRGNKIFGGYPQNPISLVWPAGYNMLQTIAGFAVDFRYGQFGAMYENENDTTPTGYVISFGGKLDLSFIMPGGAEQSKELDRKNQESNQPNSTTSRVQGEMLYSDLDSYSPSEEAKAENERNKVKPVGKVNIEDVLFGNNKGFLGFNSTVELMLPKLIDALPPLGGRLSINTIGGYDVDVLGKVKTAKLDLEFELRVKNAPDSGVPVPDKIYFFMSGFEPGVNIDGAGALWITGAGGGIDRLYDTIFSKGGLPPLTLVLSTSFDILKVMSGRADLELSLQGFRMQMRDVKIKKTDKVVLKRGTLTTRWDPKFYLDIQAIIEINNNIIQGNSYLVVDSDKFFEFFIRANVNVPKDVKLFGGMTFAKVDLGGNSDKIWGAISALGTSLGITYYWGGSDVHFGTGAFTVKPTYPELLGMGRVPAGVNPNTGEILYMAVGTNVTEGLTAQLVESFNDNGPRLMGAEPAIGSDMEKKNHRINLGTDTGDDYALTLRFIGDGRPRTIAEAQTVIAISMPDGSPYVLDFYDSSNPDADPDKANANLVVDDDTDSTTVSFTITDYVAGDWDIVTSMGADLVLYTIAALPEVTSLTAVKNGVTGNLDITWEGSGLDETKLSFYVTPDVGDEAAGDAGDIGVLIGSIGGTDSDGTSKAPPEALGQTASFAFPANLPTGEYYVRMIASKENEINQSIIATSGDSAFSFSHVNENQPDAPGGITLQNRGNNMLELKVDIPPAASFDGYSVSVYENTAEGFVPTDFMDIIFEKDEEGNIPEMLVGGRYSAYSEEGGIATERTFGLEGGRQYVARVAAYKTIDGGTPEDDSDDVWVTGTEAESNMVVLRAATPPVITFTAEPGSFKTISRTVAADDETVVTYPVETFTTNNVSFTLESDVPVTGYWSIDGTLSQDLLDPESTGLNEVSNVRTVNISRTLCDGDHTISFAGVDAKGDSFIFTKIISVDTMAPRLMLTSPTNGSFFSEDGTLMIEGVGDQDALYTITVDGEVDTKRKTLTEMGVSMDPYGVFSYAIIVDPSVSSHTIRITAEDQAGNSVTASATVNNIGLARLRDIEVLKDGEVYSNRNIFVSGTGDTSADLKLLATTDSGNSFIINDNNFVMWNTVVRKGNASIQRDGRLTVSAGSVGFAEGSLLVSEGAGMTGAVTFGSEQFSGEQYYLVLSASNGGTVTGEEGAYLSGAVIPLTAIPERGYRFSGWISSNGGSFSNASAAVTTFTMPDNDTVVTARFTLITDEQQDDEDSVHHDDDKPVPLGKEYFAQQGELASIHLPTSFTGSANTLVPYYISDGREIIIPVSSVVDGKLVFTAPATAVYYVKQNQTGFEDIQNHWAKEAIDFMVARGLFKGTGNGIFDPNGQMTRAMFITVIARLDGIDLSGFTGSKFADVPADSWYYNSVEWAANAGIVSGTGAGRFSPDEPVTREQMAVMLNNYLSYKGYMLKTLVENPQPFSDSASISGWAQHAIESMRNLGIILGKPGNLADPQGNATRAECSTVFKRIIEAVIAGSKGD